MMSTSLLRLSSHCCLQILKDSNWVHESICVAERLSITLMKKEAVGHGEKKIEQRFFFCGKLHL
jgi:hypothetical protein